MSLSYCKPIVILFLLVLCQACGTRNKLTARAPENQQELAQRDMEQEQYGSAQERLEEILRSDPANYKATSLLAAAYAAQGGVSLFRFVAAATSTTDGTQTSDPVAKFKKILPDSTSQNLEFMRLATTTMDLIPATDLDENMKFQAGIFSSTYSFLFIKYFTSSIETLATLSPADATVILERLKYATASLPGGAGATIAKVLDQAISEIESAEGQDSTEKIRKYLSTKVGS